MKLARMGLSLAAVVTVVLSTTVATEGVAYAGSESCGPILYGVVGSGEGAFAANGGPAPKSAIGAARDAFLHYYAVHGAPHGKIASFKSVNYSPVSAGLAYLSSPAELGRDLVRNLPIIGGYLRPLLPDIGNYNGLERSEQQGITVLKQLLRDRFRKCHHGDLDENVAIVGYSQGADIASRVVIDPEFKNESYVSPVALIGNPSFAVGPSNQCERDVDKDVNDNSYSVIPDGYSRNNGSYHRDRRGIRFAQHQPTYNACVNFKPYPDQDYVYPSWVPLNYCDVGDGVCNYTFPDALLAKAGVGPHLNYGRRGGLAEQAGRDLAGWLAENASRCC